MSGEHETLTADKWLRIAQVHELVKREGDAQCEAAFADLLRAHAQLKTLLAEREAEIAENSALLALMHQRERPWVERWQRETGKADTLPDYGELLAWIAGKVGLAWREAGQRLRALRLKRDLSGREAAAIVGLSAAEYSDAEQGRIDPEPIIAALMAARGAPSEGQAG